MTKKEIIVLIIKVGVGSISILAIALFASIYIFLQTLPSVSDAQQRVNVYLKENNGIRYVTNPTKEGIATIAVEDRRFYQTPGIDFFGHIKNLVDDFFTHTTTGGATITEQFAKNMYLPDDESLKGGVKIAGIALKLEMSYSKSQILNMYLNSIYYGNNLYGIRRASEGYFHKDPNNLDWAEASLLAGLPQAPSYYDPTKNFKAAKERQKIVLDALVRYGAISSSDEDSIYKEKLTIYP